MAVVSIAAGASIQQAINANPGDTTFRLASGIWREQRITAKSGNEFVGDPGATTISGARVLTQWTRQGNVWRSAQLPEPQTDANAEVLPDRPLARHQNDLFIDDRRLERVAAQAQVTAGRWWFDPTARVAVIADDPSGRLVEYSITDNFTWDNGATGCTMNNIRVEKFCTRAQQGALHGVRQWTLDRCTFRFMHGTGVVVGAGTKLQASQIRDNGQMGVSGYQSHEAVIDGCEFSGNAWAGYAPDWEAGCLKLVNSHRVQVRNNECRDNWGHGLWGDINCRDWVIEGNTVRGIEHHGIHYEISYGRTVIRNNVVEGSKRCGIYVSSASGCEVTGNRVSVPAGNRGINAGICAINDRRGAGDQGTYQITGLNVHGNTVTHVDAAGAANGIWVYQDLPANHANRFDGNTYIVPHPPGPEGRFWHFGDHNANQTLAQAQAAGYERTGQVQQPGGGGGGDVTIGPGTYRIEGTITLTRVDRTMATAGDPPTGDPPSGGDPPTAGDPSSG